MSLARYPAYKDSGVDWLGQVPTAWQVTRLMQAASVNDDLLPESTEATFEMEYVDIGSVSLDRGIERTERWSFSDAPSRARRLVRDGDVLVSTVRTYLKAIAPVAQPPENLVVSTGFAVVRPSSKLCSAYAKYLLQAKGFVDEVISRSTGVSYPAISASDLVRIFIPLPPSGEQLAIAAFLDREVAKLDALVAEQERLIVLLAEKRFATISHAVTRGLNPDTPMKKAGLAWQGEVPVHWQLKRLKHITAEVPNAFVDGPFGSNLKSEHFVDGGDVYVIESNFATQNKIDEKELKTISQSHFETIARSEVVAGDIVIAKIGAQFGKASILPQLSKRSVVSGNSLKLTVNPATCTAEWVHLQLVHLKGVGEIDLLANGSAQPALSLGGMNNLPILVPPLAEQGEVLRVLAAKTAKLDMLQAGAERTIDLLKERRSALIAAAVTGQIDVRGPAPRSLAHEELTA